MNSTSNLVLGETNIVAMNAAVPRKPRKRTEHRKDVNIMANKYENQQKYDKLMIK